MKTNELLTASEAELVPQLRAMKNKELERHAAKLLKKVGADYAQVLAAVTKAVPELGAEQNAFARIQEIVRACGQVDADQKIIERVAVIMMIIIKKQFLKIHSQN
ncbi:MAG: hypothetical protein NVV73_05730 [Cellvibrionaceae bacterium]|nr:hypothetical protein [Cellvibrionaceae bacterium]